MRTLSCGIHNERTYTLTAVGAAAGQPRLHHGSHVCLCMSTHRSGDAPLAGAACGRGLLRSREQDREHAEVRDIMYDYMSASSMAD